MLTLGVATLGWWGMTVLAPAFLARRALQSGKRYLAQKEYDKARQVLRRASQNQRFKREASWLMAEASIRAGQPEEAIQSILPAEVVRSSAPGLPARARFLLGVAYAMLARGTAAETELAEVVGVDGVGGTAEERLAAVHACLIARDIAGAERIMARLDSSLLGGAALARRRICRAAIYWHRGQWEKVLKSLPSVQACDPADQLPVLEIRKAADKKLKEAAGQSG
jgi:hypothetical protein